MKCGKLKIDLGCGPNKHEDYIGLDIHDYSHLYPEGEFIQWDLEKGALPFCTNSVKSIWCTSVLEHIHNFIPLMNECWRVLRPGGDMYILVPKAGGEGSFKDPTHCRFFLNKTFDYFTKSVRQENYGIKPWELVTNRMWKGGQGTIEVVMKPVK